MRFGRVILVIVAWPVLAQQPPRAIIPNELVMIERYATRVNRISADIKRDAFIVAQIVAGLGELKDFQKNAAVSKALDRVKAAQKRAGEDPKASIFTMTAINKCEDAVRRAQQQGSTADLEALRKEVLEQTHTIQLELFKELDVARRERQALVDTQTRLAQVGQELDGSMMDALGSTFDFFRAGGK